MEMNRMKTLTYKYEDIERMAELISRIPFSGFETARVVSEIGNILDSGTTGEIMQEGGGRNGVEHKKVQQDKLEKQTIHGYGTRGNEPEPDGCISE